MSTFSSGGAMLTPKAVVRCSAPKRGATRKFATPPTAPAAQPEHTLSRITLLKSLLIHARCLTMGYAMHPPVCTLPQTGRTCKSSRNYLNMQPNKVWVPRHWRTYNKSDLKAHC